MSSQNGMSMRASIGEVIKLVNKIKKGLRAQKRLQDQRHRKIMDDCRVDFIKYEKQIDILESSFGKFEQMVKIEEPVLISRRQEFANRKAELQTRKTHLVNITREDKRLAEKFQENMKEHDQVKSLIYKARSIMNHAFKTHGKSSETKNSKSFLQMSSQALSRLHATLTNFSPRKNHGFAHGYMAIFAHIARVVERKSVHADMDMVDIILRIFNDVLENVDRSREIEIK